MWTTYQASLTGNPLLGVPMAGSRTIMEASHGRPPAMLRSLQGEALAQGAW